MKALFYQRRVFQAGFFILFIFAPILDIFRLDLNLGHFIIFGYNWTLGLEAFQAGDMSALQAAFNVFTRVFLPIGLVIGAGVYVAWKYGRLYCGWLCPHFSVVETINRLMLRASGKPSIWEKKALPREQADASVLTVNKSYWLMVAFAVLFFSFLWAVVLLTYLLPPKTIYDNLFNLELTRNQGIFIGVGTLLLAIEFTFARHLFCRFACAVGVFQSLAWMGNKKAMVVGFNVTRARDCQDCNNACDNACPMRLKPRTVKRNMFTCTNCAECIQACETHNAQTGKTSLLKWVEDECALQVSDSGFGKYPEMPAHCFQQQDGKVQPKVNNDHAERISV